MCSPNQVVPQAEMIKPAKFGRFTTKKPTKMIEPAKFNRYTEADYLEVVELRIM
jgi:hypothetical protein